MSSDNRIDVLESLKNMNTHSKTMVETGKEEKIVAKGAFWHLAGSGLTKLMSFLYLFIIAHLFSQVDVGTFYLALSIIGMVLVFGNLGLGAAFARYVPFFMGKGEEEKVYFLLQKSQKYSFIISFVTAAFLFLSSGIIAELFGNPALSEVLKLLSIYLVVKVLFSLNLGFLRGLKRIKEASILDNLQNSLKIILTLVFYWFMGGEINVLAIGFLGSFALAFIFSLSYVKREVHKLNIGKEVGHISRNELLGKIIPFGLMLGVAGLFWTVINYIDRIMLGFLLPPESSAVGVAVYAVSISFAIIIMVFPGSVVSIFLPMITELFAKEKKREMLKLSETSVRWTIMITTPATLMFIIFPKELLEMIYGSEYGVGAGVLTVFAIGLFIRSLSHIQTSILAALRMVKIEILIVGFASLINIFLNWILISEYGVIGAAYASAASFLVVTLLMSYYSKKIFGFSFSRDIYKLLIVWVASVVLIFAFKGAAIGMVESVSLAGLEGGSELVNTLIEKISKLVILGIIFLFICFVYYSVLVITRLFRKEDIVITSGIMRRMKVPGDWIRFVEMVLGKKE